MVAPGKITLSQIQVKIQLIIQEFLSRGKQWRYFGLVRSDLGSFFSRTLHEFTAKFLN